MRGLGNRLTNFDFSGNLAPLADTVNLDPEVTKLALQFAQNSLTPAFRDTVTGLKNEAANAGALESSTFTDALSKAGQDLNSQFQAITSGAALDDRSRALNNRIGLFNEGTGLIDRSTGYGLQNQGQQNQFNLNNYDNQVAQAVNNQKQQSGGWSGALQGAAGGAMAGSAFGPWGAIIGGVGGGLSGGLSPQSSNAGGAILGAGSSIYGYGGRNVAPGSTAGALTDDPYQRLLGSLKGGL